MGVIHYFNGNVYNGKNNFLDEFYVENKKFVDKRTEIEKSIDLKGKTVVPGFIDTHTHLTYAGIHQLGVSLRGIRSKNKILEMLNDYYKSSERKIYFGYGFDDTIMVNNDKIIKEDLNKISKNSPIYIQRIDQHSLIVNDKFEEIFNIKSKNGFINSTKYEKIKIKLVESFTNKDLYEGLVKMQKKVFKKGVTTVCTMEGVNRNTQSIDYLLNNRNKFKLDFLIYPQIMSINKIEKRGFNRIGGCILLDGSFGSYTAALNRPYSDNNKEKGILYLEDDKLFTFMERAHLKGMQLSFHAIGDRAIDQAVSNYEKLLTKHPKKDHRHRIEHFELASIENIKKVSELGINISYQPVFEYLWGGKNKMYEKRLNDRYLKTNRYKTALKYGVKFGFGSDCDVTPVDPIWGIHAAVNRENKEENITVKNAVNSFTKKAAEIGKIDEKVGTIEKNKKADFAILNKNIFKIDKKLIKKEIKVEKLYKNGNLVFES